MPGSVYCECGCGQEPKPGKRYIHNHHWRGKTRPFRAQSAEANAKRSETQLIYPKGARCAIEDCDMPREHRDWCTKHYTRWLRYGDPATVHARGFSAQAEDHPSWKGDDVCYRTAHTRVRSQRGEPEVCAHCGGDAMQWALDHERCVTPLRSPEGLLYSPDVHDYMPLCIPCHTEWDSLHARLSKRTPQA